MNPSAQAFVPKRTAKEPPRPPAPVASTKLNATAVPFVPGGSSSTSNSATFNSSPLTPQQAPPPQYQAPGQPPQQHQQHRDPAAEEAAAAAVPSESLSVEASAYTPADPKIASKTSASAEKNTSSNPPPPAAAATAAAAVAEVEPAAAAEDAAEPTEDAIPPAQPVDWSKSKLPKIFGCHNTAAKATKSAIPLHVEWDLYADDHSSHGSSNAVSTVQSPASTPFEPVLVASVADVESFWRLLHYVPAPSGCPVPFTYSFFRHDIKPEWEHPRNKKGGTITVTIYDRDRPGLNDRQVLDDAYMTLLLGCIGESFAESNSTVNGLMLKLRPNRPVVVQLWVAHSEAGKLKTFAHSLRETLEKVIGSKQLQKLEFYSHNQKQAGHGQNSLASRITTKPKTKPDLVF